MLGSTVFSSDFLFNFRSLTLFFFLLFFGDFKSRHQTLHFSKKCLCFLFPSIKRTDCPCSQSDFLKGNVSSLNNMAIDFSLVSTQSLMNGRLAAACSDACARLWSVCQRQCEGRRIERLSHSRERRTAREWSTTKLCTPLSSSHLLCFYPGVSFLSYITYTFHLMFTCVVWFLTERLRFL